MVTIKLTNDQLLLLTKQWSGGNYNKGEKVYKFLVAFGPSGSSIANEFFNWVKETYRGSINAEPWQTTYDVVFDDDRDATAFILKF